MLIDCNRVSNRKGCLFQESLGDVVYAQLPEPEESVAAGEDCGALESVKGRGLPGCRRVSLA